MQSHHAIQCRIDADPRRIDVFSFFAHVSPFASPSPAWERGSGVRAYPPASFKLDPSVVEAGVVGIPDEVAGNVIKAFVTLAEGVDWDDDLRLEMIGFARKRLGPAVAPRDIAAEPHLPKTRSGKIMRRLLRARELGLPEGDLSTLEPDPPTRAQEPSDEP